MADDDKKAEAGSPWAPLWFVVLLIGGLVVLWFFNGGPERGSLRGIFVAPPPPLGSGEVYGPTINEGGDTNPQ